MSSSWFEPGVLTIATGEPAFQPWVIDDDPTNQQGFEAAVAYAVATQLGFTPEQVTWIRTGFDEAVAPGPKEFDFNLQQYSITDERDEVVDFSIPYYVTDQALVAFADSPVTAANTVEDLKGYNLGAQIGTTSLDYIEEVIQPDTPPAVYDTNSRCQIGPGRRPGRSSGLRPPHRLLHHCRGDARRDHRRSPGGIRGTGRSIRAAVCRRKPAGRLRQRGIGGPRSGRNARRAGRAVACLRGRDQDDHALT